MLKKIPAHLKVFIAQQDPTLYTAIDHASWRYIMRLSQAFFAENAHQKYLDGLVETGIEIERIPLIYEMDEKLSRFGWSAAPIVGFIPPAAFMEFLSLGILPIACDMRRAEHLSYTPVPDIVHEAAGHAPILADPDFAHYLHQYGEIARKVIFSDQDIAVYNAIRELSDIKENPVFSEEQISAAQKKLDVALAAVSWTSEATQLSRMGWWTFEYGLIGSLDNPKIYGAGLLSSVGESYNCLKGSAKRTPVKFLPLTLDCIHQGFDITRPQPQLYVTPSFQHLCRVLEEFAKTLSYQRGGKAGLECALKSKTVTTTQLDSGLQISGKIARVLYNDRAEAEFLKFEGPCQLSYHDKECDGQGVQNHLQGFSTPLGKIRGVEKTASDLLDTDFQSLGFFGEQKGAMNFESGIHLTGVLRKKTSEGGKNIILTFSDCRIYRGEEVFYQPDWGPFDLACGEKVVSVFGEAADREKYLMATGGFHQTPVAPKTNLTEANRDLAPLYAQVREVREKAMRSKTISNPGRRILNEIHQYLEEEFPFDWLLRLELLELDYEFKMNARWALRAREVLNEISKLSDEKKELIDRGLQLLS